MSYDTSVNASSSSLTRGEDTVQTSQASGLGEKSGNGRATYTRKKAAGKRLDPIAGKPNAKNILRKNDLEEVGSSTSLLI